MKRATRKQLIECIKSLLSKDWSCAWDGRDGIDPSIMGREILNTEKIFNHKKNIK